MGLLIPVITDPISKVISDGVYIVLDHSMSERILPILS